MKTLASLGEDAVVELLTRALPSRPDVRAGAGDDCAVLGGKRDVRWRLLKTDAVVEGVHFLPDEKPTRVGWKALCRAISDIAAMGGLPEHALVTLAVKPETPVEWVRGLYAGLRRAARKFGVAIVGGETSRSPGPVFLSIALSGSVERARCVRRDGGRAGDAIFVTGRLGGSIEGKHLEFTPRLAEARWLVEHFRPTAMMDLSDGLAADLPRLAKASGCGVEIWKDAIPCSPGCDGGRAMSDGEDYELLFSIAPRQATVLLAAWKKAFPKVPLTHIGYFRKASARFSFDFSAQAGQADKTRGYDHFA